jgi:hypothetical protein
MHVYVVEERYPELFCARKIAFPVRFYYREAAYSCEVHSVEQWVQAVKSLVFAPNNDLLGSILRLPNHGSVDANAVSLGREVPGYDEAAWRRMACDVQAVGFFFAACASPQVMGRLRDDAGRHITYTCKYNDSWASTFAEAITRVRDWIVWYDRANTMVNWTDTKFVMRTNCDTHRFDTSGCHRTPIERANGVIFYSLERLFAAYPVVKRSDSRPVPPQPVVFQLVTPVRDPAPICQADFVALYTTTPSPTRGQAPPEYRD